MDDLTNAALSELTASGWPGVVFALAILIGGAGLAAILL